VGKEKDLGGKIVKTGITPLPALGVTDQHSQSQLFVEGPDDKFIIFVNVQNHQSKIRIPNQLPDSFKFLQNLSFEELIHAEFEGTKNSYTEKNKPNCTIEMPQIDAFELAKVFILLELATAFLGEMLSINTFDQPGVERSKILTKQILESR
jgi:glucose-6-phosphate isomerase